jgi:hypothetical protein
MDATTITRVMKELMKLLRDMHEFGEDYNYEKVESKVKELKAELGSWFIEDYTLYVGS